MPRNTPHDRFDSLPRSVDRIGAHRAPGKKGRGWIAFAWAAGATILLVGAGATVLFLQSDRLNFTLPGAEAGSVAETSTPTPTPTPTPTETPTEEPAPEPEPAPAPVPTVDPSLSVTVLNGTTGSGIAREVGELLSDAGWSVDTTGDASSEDFSTTTVYYSDPALEGAALGAAGSIPGAQISLSDDFAGSGADLTIIVGNDYL